MSSPIDPTPFIAEERPPGKQGLLTLLFTDLVGSTRLKQNFGDRDAVALIDAHHALVRLFLAQFDSGEEIKTAGDSFFLVFGKPSDAVKFSLLLLASLREFNQQRKTELRDRVGIHLGEVVVQHSDSKGKDLHGLQVDICARVMSLADGNQILLTRSVFDNARQALKGTPGVAELSWLNHGLYALYGVEEPVEICEVGEVGHAPLRPPADSEKVRRYISPENESVSGWRPALEQPVPGTNWILHERLGEGGFGEVWVARHKKLGQYRVFKFCFRAERVRSLKREVTLFRLLKERVGEHPNIVALRDVNFDESPHYVEMDYVEGKDLRSWSEDLGGASKLSFDCRIELIAQAADGLQAAHDAGIVHRDVKPGNILVSGKPTTSNLPALSNSLSPSAIQVRLTDFGIGQVMSEELLDGMTRAGFTQTIAVQPSSSQSGTQIYMAPELLAGQPASPQSDLYSLGIVLYQLLVGNFKRPISTDWSDEITDPILLEDLKRCLAGDPKKRFSSAAELARRLRSIPERRRELARHQAELAARVRAAYRRGLVRATTVALIVITATTLLAFSAIRQRNRALAQEAENRLLLNAAEINLAQRYIESGTITQARELLDRQPPDLRGFEWRFLKQLSLPDYFLSLTGHIGLVQSVAISPDGKTLASADYGARLIRLWDLTSRANLREPLPTVSDIRSVIFSQDGSKLAAAGNSPSAIQIWDTKSWTPSLLLTNSNERSGISYVERIAFAPSGNILAAAETGANQGSVWDLNTSQRVALFKGIGYRRACVDFSPDGQWLAFGTGDNLVQLVRATDYSLAATLSGHSSVPSYLDFSPDSKTLASAGSDGDVRLWEIPSGRLAAILAGHKGHVTSVAFSPTGDRLASSSGNGTLKLWNVASRQEIATLRGHAGWVNNVVFSADGSSLVSGSDDSTIKFWKADLTPRTYYFPANPISVADAQPSPDSKFIASVESGGSITVRSTATQKLHGSLEDAQSPFTHCAWFPDSQHLIAIQQNGAVRVWNFETQVVLNTFNLPHSPNSPRHFVVSTDLKFHFITEKGSLLVYDLKSGFPSQTPSLPLPAEAIYPSLEGNIIAILREKNALVLRDVSQGAIIGRVDNYPKNLPAPLFSGNFRWALQIHDLNVRIWETNNPASPRLLLRGQPGAFSPPVFSPDYQLLAGGFGDNIIRIWNLQTLQQIMSLDAHSGWITGLAFSPDTRILASASMDATVRLWSLANGRELMTMPGNIAPFSILLRFTPDGNGLYCLGEDNFLRFWRAPSD